VGRVEAFDLFSIFEQLTHAVGAAHAAGIVHRDLKPENIFLARSMRAGSENTVKVLDFGIAKLVAEAHTSSNTAAMGSAYWMAPEQTEQAAPITPATDVWALGLIAYRLLTGKVYWRAAADPNTSVTMFLRELVLEPLPSASARAAQQGVKEFLPAGFDEWFGRCVTRDQRARFSNARAAGAALRELRGARTSIEPASLLSGRGVVVRASDPSARTGGETGLGSARTLADVPVPRDDEAPTVVPTKSLSFAAIFAGAGGVAAIGLLAFVWTRAPASTPVAPPVIEAGAAVAKELRCPKTMIPIVGGSFRMGADDGAEDQRPAHLVELNGFCLDMTEVQVGEYKQCVTAKACAPPSSEVVWAKITPEDRKLFSEACNGNKPERDDHPINCVTQDEARAYCQWANKRLPSEEEWEFAARGHESRLYPWGDEPPSAQRLNACGAECAKGALLGDRSLTPLFEGSDGWETTAPTRSYPAGKTKEGVFDLAGNVAEWVSGKYCPYPGRDCSVEWRVARGGGWNSDLRDGVKAARREKNAHDARSADIGFRCAQ
jgi:eukaryotic-like serine/threonine-protein kinase